MVRLGEGLLPAETVVRGHRWIWGCGEMILGGTWVGGKESRRIGAPFVSVSKSYGAKTTSADKRCNGKLS